MSPVRSARGRFVGRVAMVGAVGLLSLVGPVVVMATPASASTPGDISVFAGVLSGSGSPAPTSATNYAFDDPIRAAFDPAGNAYVVDDTAHLVLKITPQGELSVFAGVTGQSGVPQNGAAADTTPLGEPEGIAVDAAGDVYISDQTNNQVYKVSPSGTLSYVVSSGLSDPAALALDPEGNLYIANSGDYDVEKLTPAGVLTNIAGVPGVPGTTTGGPATSQHFENIQGIATDGAGNVYVADLNNDVVSKIAPGGTLSLFAGDVDGPTPASRYPLDGPAGLAVDSAGNVYISDSGAAQVVKVTLTGGISVVAGNGTSGPPNTSGPATSSPVGFPYGLALDASGDLYICDLGYPAVEEVALVSAPSAPVVGTPTLAGGALHLPWTPIPSATRYTVTVSVNGVAQPPVTVSSAGYTVASPVPGSTYSFTVSATNVIGTGPASGPSPSLTVPVPATSGYWTVGGDGGVFSFGAHFYGSTGGLTLNQPVFAITSTKDGKGYWFVARDGGVFSYGDAAFHGSVPLLGDQVTDIVGMAADPATGGYWLVGADGGVYAFDAPFDGSVPGLGQHVADVVGMAATPDGGGYDLVTSTGAVYAFGDATYQGGANTLAHLNAPIVGMSIDPATGGYWLAGADGGVYAYGAPFEGSAGGITLNAPVVGISATTDSGYYLVASDGGVFAYHAPFLGSMGGTHLNAPMVGITVAG